MSKPVWPHWPDGTPMSEWECVLNNLYAVDVQVHVKPQEKTMGKPHKFANEIAAKAQGKSVQERWISSNKGWVDMKDADFHFIYDCEYRIKPEPKYPETRMTEDEAILEAKKRFISADRVVQYSPWINVANAAIRRAIQDGDVILPGEK